MLMAIFSHAQTGWDYIKANDNKAARRSFTADLQKDSLNADAIKGLIYLSDIEQDKIAYRKYANSLIRNFPNEHVFSVLKNAYSGPPDLIVKQKDFSERSKLFYKLIQAAELKEKRQFNESKSAYNALLGDYQWSVIGPFKNVSGSGFGIEYPVETDTYDSVKIYTNHRNLELKWVKPKYYDPSDKVNFSRHLPNNYNGGTYYANSFISVPESKTIQLRIGSSSPIKIWLDNSLVFENKNITRFQWDGEIIELNISAGTHRILVKCSTPPQQTRHYDFLSFFDSPGVSDLNLSSWMSDYISLINDDSNNDPSFSLRIADTNGNLLNIGAAAPSRITSAIYHPVIYNNFAINYFKGLIDQSPDDLFNYYALCKAYFMTNLTKQAEPFFVKALRNQKDLVLLKYITAKIYAENGKTEKAYQVLNDINQEKTPIFGLLYSKFRDIDLGTEEQKYLLALDRLKAITPSNYSVISAYMKYYDKKGMQKQKEDFINEMKKAYPVYKESLDVELDTEPMKDLTEKERSKGTRITMGKIKSRFSTIDYSTAIYYYKNKGKPSRVLELYDELIKYLPYNIEYRQDKAQYLLSEKKYREALKELQEALSIAPYNNLTLEYIGDVYNDKNKNNPLASDSIALKWYKLSKKYQRQNYGIDTKITRIEGQKKLKRLFTTKSFDDILADEGWKNKYTKEDAIILLYTRDLAYDSMAHVEVYQQMMIKIMNESGAKRWTEYDFGFLGALNTLRVIKPNGAEVSPDKQGSYVVIKNLEPGDIIQIDGMQEWEQQSELDQELSLIHYVSFEAPIYYHKFEVAVPEKKYLGYMYHKLDSALKKYTNNGFDFYKWEYYNMSKVENEDATLDLYDLYSSIMISSIPDWSKLVDWYTQITYDKFEMTYEVKEALDSIIRPGMNDGQKVEAIYNYLTKEIKYSYVPFLQSGYIPKDPGLTLSSRIGDCKDVATLMIVMLKAIGIEANYALVKTNSYNHQEMLPSLYFDHVVVQYLIGGHVSYLDMTTDYYPYYVLTENDANAFSLIIKAGEKEVSRLPGDDLDPSKNKIEYSIDARLNSDKTVDLAVEATYPGIAGGSIREYFSTISEQEQKNYITEHSGKGVFTDITLLDYHFGNMKDISKPLKATFHFKATEFSDEVANLFIFRIPYMNAVRGSAAISGDHRHNRINVDKLSDTEPTIQKITLHFPKNYRLLKLPENINYQSKYGSYKAAFKKTTDGIAIEKQQAFNTKIVSEKEFDEFKAFYLKLLNFDKTKIAIQHL
ncbi:MAG: hypothetical protein JNL63_12755 [Bacteroidia bacterium]|nr:hypothetical protein [Bacteroidia bacterium]